MKKYVEHFKHLTKQNNPSLDALVAQYGSIGYAFYYITLEGIYGTGAPVDLNSEVAVSILMAKLKVDRVTLFDVAAKAVSVGLFDKDVWEHSRSIWSEKIQIQVDAKNKRRKLDNQRKLENSATVSATPKPLRSKPGTELMSTEESIKKAEIDHGNMQFLLGTLKYSLSEIGKMLEVYEPSYINEKISYTKDRLAGLINPAAFFMEALKHGWTDYQDEKNKSDMLYNDSIIARQKEDIKKIEEHLERGFRINSNEYLQLPNSRKETLSYDEEHYKKTSTWLYYDPKKQLQDDRHNG